eukprot:6381856-Pyramimonas_sp.AAC.1
MTHVHGGLSCANQGARAGASSSGGSTSGAIRGLPIVAWEGVDASFGHFRSGGPDSSYFGSGSGGTDAPPLVAPPGDAGTSAVRRRRVRFEDEDQE